MRIPLNISNCFLCLTKINTLSSLNADSVNRGMAIDELGRVRLTPNDDPGADLPVTVTVTDALGATTEQSFTVSVVNDEQAPLVSLNPSLNPLYLGQDITF